MRASRLPARAHKLRHQSHPGLEPGWRPSMVAPAASRTPASSRTPAGASSSAQSQAKDSRARLEEAGATTPDWRRVSYLLQASRALDEIEESTLLPQRKVLYQFSARGHELGQILLGLQLTDRHDGVTVYYRSRPVMLALGVSLEEA